MLSAPRTYSVQRAARQPLIDFMVEGLKESGAKVLYTSQANRAPFAISVELPSGERLGLIAYAFLATRTPTRKRPPDERSFQIKYGEKRGGSHELWQDPLGLYTTLLIGIDPVENYFVSADPLVHSPTKFFIRLEFKDRHADAIKRASWHSWSRERRATRGCPEKFEALVGGKRERFLDAVRFERAAKAFSQKDRLALARKW